MSLLFNAPEQPCRSFSMSELSSATNSFDEKWCIGQGGFGKVYKGKISQGPNNTYAIKRLHFMSNQGESEFWVEVEMLSKLRHCNLVSLIGYCNEEKEMALVYEYMPNGTLYDHLHSQSTHLTWSQRLNICIGAGRGLDYLHTGTGTQQGVIHRDVKTSNILLDQNYAAKIADFGLAKIGPINQTRTYVSTTVKGTFGYMDPNYFYTGRLTRKSDVYAFGVVLLEVLSGRPALDESLDEGLAVWGQDRIKQGKVTHIIDSRLKHHISKSSLKEFTRITVRCMLSNPNQRPTMSEVVGSLERALSFHERKASSTLGRITIKKVWSLLSLKGYFELRTLGTTETKEYEDVSIGVPAIATGVELDQREPQEDNRSTSNLVNTSYLIPPIDTSSSPSTPGPVETFAGTIKESIRISNGEDGYLDSNSLNGDGGLGVGLGSKSILDHVSTQDGENYGFNTKTSTSNSGNNAPSQVEEWVDIYETGVYIQLLALPDGTNELKRVRFGRTTFDRLQAETWWSENGGKVYERYKIRLPTPP